jgi:neutral ceramidase
LYLNFLFLLIQPILLNTGTAKVPYAWDPIVVPLSVFRIGQLFIVSVPGEFTTMAGRRLRNAVVQIATEHGIENPFVTIAGLANTYTGYIVTHEEYIGQRYEAASTLYGPHTLSAYIQEFKRLTRDLLNDKASVSEAAPLDLSKYQVSLLPPVVFDSIRFGRKVSLRIDQMSIQ